MELYMVSPDYEDKLIKWLEKVSEFGRRVQGADSLVSKVNEITVQVIGLKPKKMLHDSRGEKDESFSIHDQIYQCAVQGEQLLQLILDKQKAIDDIPSMTISDNDKKPTSGRPNQAKYDERSCNIFYGKKTLKLRANSKMALLCQILLSKQTEVGESISWVKIYRYLYDKEATDNEDWRKIDDAVRRFDAKCEDIGMPSLLEFKGGSKGYVKRMY